MLKRLGVAFAALFAFVSLAQGAGTVPGFNLVPTFDLTGKIAPGCKLYVIQAGTVSTPQNPYQDSGLTILAPNPLTCDAAGRLPQWFVADGNIKLRLTTSTGTQIFVQDNLLVVGASSGGGGGGSVDPTTILATGDFKLVYNTGTLTGFVRCNGRTIGNATSGATERANADTSALFAFLWNNDSNLSVSGGRGVSAAADYAANKAITLPDCKGRSIAGLDDMGASAAGRLTSSYFGATATTLGAVGGGESTTLTLAQLPTGITSSGSNSITVNTAFAGEVFPTVASGNSWFLDSTSGSGAFFARLNSSTSVFNRSSLSGSNSIAVTSNNTSGNAHRTVQPTILMTIYIKL